ncbi:hypothetical protein HY17_00560 [Hyphomonas sp. CY54-11-8]|nr:hypothetical protein HY17_00560 [Hyphomonas sp. CY54-11-8]
MDVASGPQDSEILDNNFRPTNLRPIIAISKSNINLVCLGIISKKRLCMSPIHQRYTSIKFT